jgi:hypothetical protein
MRRSKSEREEYLNLLLQREEEKKIKNRTCERCNRIMKTNTHFHAFEKRIGIAKCSARSFFYLDSMYICIGCRSTMRKIERQFDTYQANQDILVKIQKAMKNVSNS